VGIFYEIQVCLLWAEVLQTDGFEIMAIESIAANSAIFRTFHWVIHMTDARARSNSSRHEAIYDATAVVIAWWHICVV